MLGDSGGHTTQYRRQTGSYRVAAVFGDSRGHWDSPCIADARGRYHAPYKDRVFWKLVLSLSEIQASVSNPVRCRLAKQKSDSLRDKS